jgi:hypothetical protein
MIKKKMLYNRAVIIRNEISKPLLEKAEGGEDDAYWLFDSMESFHGEHDDKFFHFKDSRIPSCLKLPMSCVELEFSKEEIEERERDV